MEIRADLSLLLGLTLKKSLPLESGSGVYTKDSAKQRRHMNQTLGPAEQKEWPMLRLLPWIIPSLKNQEILLKHKLSHDLFLKIYTAPLPIYPMV